MTDALTPRNSRVAYRKGKIIGAPAPLTVELEFSSEMDPFSPLFTLKKLLAIKSFLIGSLVYTEEFSMISIFFAISIGFFQTVPN